jgi:hypothetical protein
MTPSAAFVKLLFDDHDLMRLVLEQWRDKSTVMHETLVELYVVLYRVVFETATCFAVMNTSVFTHEFNGFEVGFELMSQPQRLALGAVLDHMDYHISHCPFLDTISLTGFQKDECESDWCNTQQLFSTFVDMELASAVGYPEGLLRADTLSIVLQDMLVSSTRIAPKHAQYLQTLLEVIHATPLPLQDGDILKQLYF